jgi:hypothetical protein
VGHGIAALAPGGTSGSGEGLTGGDGEEGFGTRDKRGGFGVGTTEPLELSMFLGSEGTERVFLWTGHEQAPGETRGERAAQ